MVVWFYYIVNIHFCQVNKVNFCEYSVKSRECCEYYNMIIKDTLIKAQRIKIRPVSMLV